MCVAYVDRSTDEIPYEKWAACQRSLPSLITVEGFEERSLGLLRHFADMQTSLPSVVIARYANDEQLNTRYRNDFEQLAKKTSSGRWTAVKIDSEGKWLQDALDLAETDEVMIDITGMFMASL